MVALLCSTLFAPGPPEASFASSTAVLINRERAREGLDPLKLSDILSKAAQAHAQDMSRRGYFDHSTPEGDSFGVWARNLGYGGFCMAQNIAFGAADPRMAVQLWMKSPPHRRAILRRDVDELGAGLAGSDAISVLNFGQSGLGIRVVIAGEAPSVGLTSEVFAGPLMGSRRMRLKEDGGQWSEWKEAHSRFTWTFSGPGRRRLAVEIEHLGVAEDDVMVQLAPNSDHVSAVGLRGQP